MTFVPGAATTAGATAAAAAAEVARKEEEEMTTYTREGIIPLLVALIIFAMAR